MQSFDGLKLFFGIITTTEHKSFNISMISKEKLLPFSEKIIPFYLHFHSLASLNLGNVLLIWKVF